VAPPPQWLCWHYNGCCAAPRLLYSLHVVSSARRPAACAQLLYVLVYIYGQQPPQLQRAGSIFRATHQTYTYSARYTRLVSFPRLPRAVRGFAPRRPQGPNHANLDSRGLGLRNVATYAKNGDFRRPIFNHSAQGRFILFNGI